jgi:hypothetical protein
MRAAPFVVLASSAYSLNDATHRLPVFESIYECRDFQPLTLGNMLLTIPDQLQVFVHIPEMVVISSRKWYH